MKALLVDAPPSLLDERKRRGIDKLDERWEGVWHLVNPPKMWHADLSADLLGVLSPIAAARGLRAYGDGVGVFGAPDDWRVPDQVYARPEHRTEDGVTSAEVVVEIRSPGDETYEKLPFYAARGVAEVLVLHQDRRAELYRLRDDGEYVQLQDEAGRTHSATLGVTFARLDTSVLRLTWGEGHAEV